MAFTTCHGAQLRTRQYYAAFALERHNVQHLLRRFVTLQYMYSTIYYLQSCVSSDGCLTARLRLVLLLLLLVLSRGS
jgi:hypothetical protein